MKELSLNILDIAQNSVKANSQKIEIMLSEQKGWLTIVIADDGHGMEDLFLQKVLDPFTTTRNTRKVGLGLSFFKQSAELAGGNLTIESKVGAGTIVTATFQIDNIDRMPVGDLAGTLVTLVQGSPDIRYILTCKKDENAFTVDTDEIRKVLGEVKLDNPEVLAWIFEYVSENMIEIKFIN